MSGPNGPGQRIGNGTTTIDPDVLAEAQAALEKKRARIEERLRRVESSTSTLGEVLQDDPVLASGSDSVSGSLAASAPDSASASGSGSRPDPLADSGSPRVERPRSAHNEGLKVLKVEGLKVGGNESLPPYRGNEADERLKAARQLASELLPEGAEEAGDVDTNPLRVAVREALAASRACMYDEQIRNRNWRSPSWEFAVRLFLHADIADLDAEEASWVVEPILENMLDEGRITPDGDFVSGDDEEDAWMKALTDRDSHGDSVVHPRDDFLRAWDLIKARTDPAILVNKARRRAKKYPTEFGGKWVSKRDANFRTLLNMFRLASSMSSDGVAFLGQQVAAKALGTSRRAVGYMLERAEKSGFLVKVADAVPHKRAAEYRLGPKMPKAWCDLGTEPRKPQQIRPDEMEYPASRRLMEIAQANIDRPWAEDLPPQQRVVVGGVDAKP